MATLLIGGNGLLGSHLIPYLCTQGEEVISFSGHAPSVEVKGCTYIQGDVTEYGTLNMILKEHKVDRIIHNAAVSHPKLFKDNPYKVYRVNVCGTLTALEAARNYGIDRFVYISSGAVYGNIYLPVVTEDVRLHGENPYGASKVASEELVRNYGLDSVSLRVGFIYGPGRKLECPIRSILMDALAKGKVDWEHGIDQRLDYVYIDDVVRAVTTIAFADKLKHTEYNIGGGEEIIFSRVVDTVRQMFPNMSIHVGPGDLGFDSLGAMSMERAINDYGFHPDISIEEGIARYATYLKSRI